MDAISTSIQLLNLIIAGTATAEKFIEMRNQLEQIQSEGRDPTEDEWNAMIADAQAQGDQLDAVDKTLNP